MMRAIKLLREEMEGRNKGRCKEKFDKISDNTSMTLTDVVRTLLRTFRPSSEHDDSACVVRQWREATRSRDSDV